MQKNSTKKSLVLSVISLLLCLSMLAGTTFAWFTDSVTSGKNRILAGNLDIELEYLDNNGKWQTVTEQTNVFEQNTLWEPGHTEVVYLRVKNAGSLAFKYQLGVNVASETGSVNVNGEPFKLSEFIEFGAVEGVKTPFADRTAARRAVSVSEPLASGYTAFGTMSAGATEQYTALVVFMPESVGNEANYKTGETAPEIFLGIDLFATQYEYESDSFDKNYDKEAVMPDFSGKYTVKADVGSLDGDNKTTDAIELCTDGSPVYAQLPAGVEVEDGKNTLTLEIEKTDRSSNIEVNTQQSSLSLDVHIDGIGKNNTVPITVALGAVAPKGLKASSVELYHVENGIAHKMTPVDSFTAHNQFIYNAKTGEISIHIASFSEITMLISMSDPWNGTVDTSWYNNTDSTFKITTAEQLAGLGQLVARGNTFEGKTVELNKSLDLGSKSGKVFLSIGYDPDYSMSSLGEFKGVFDGKGNTVSNLYQNTWQIKGNYDNGYYKLSMGLFGLVSGTVKNLNIYRFSMEGEFAPMGCVAGRANGGTFENIRLIECAPYTYNTGVGGIIGWDVSSGATYNFKNINIDPTSTVGALWGTYDAACGGIMGYISKASTANITDCNIGCVLDVYNDVCGNYQYYQYRYSGMVIGTVGRDSAADISNIHCKNVKIFYNEWPHYFYCEFEKNSLASYSEDYQFSRVEHKDIKFNDKNGNGRIDSESEALSATGCKNHNHTAQEDKQAVYLPFNQMISGYGWGAEHKDIPGVEVAEYAYSITYKEGEKTLITEYVIDNSKVYTVADVISGYDHWEMANGNPVTTIKAGNTTDYILYLGKENEYVARFVDQHGNLVVELPFSNGSFKNGAQAPATPPYIGDEFDGVWETYNLKVKNDIVVRPIYTYKGNLTLTPVDSTGDGITDYYRVDATKNLSGTVTIPGYLNGIPVEIVSDLCYGNDAWNLNSAMTKVTVQEGVERIEADALAYTTKLAEVDLPSTLTYIGSNAFGSDLGKLGSLVGQKQVITFNYSGTMADWEAIQKASDWDHGLVVNSKVVCLDGEFLLTKSAGYFGSTSWSKTPY